MRELELIQQYGAPKTELSHPSRVRELKLLTKELSEEGSSRTPPGVRELNH